MNTLLYPCVCVCVTVDKLRDELHRERQEKESMEESCRQLKQTSTQLQQRVKELTVDQSQSMSVEDHRAALNEMQQWVAMGCAGCARTCCGNAKRTTPRAMAARIKASPNKEGQRYKGESARTAVWRVRVERISLGFLCANKVLC